MEFDSMKRKDLQALCKKHGIPANLTNLEMKNRLTEVFKEEENSEEEVKKEVKKVRFNHDVETREYEKSGYEKPVRRRITNPPVPKESDESSNVVVGKKKSRVTRSQAVVVEEEATAKIETVRGKRGLSKSVKIDTVSAEEEEEEKPSKGVRRSKRTAVQYQSLLGESDAVQIKDSSKGVSTRKSVVDGKVGSDGHEMLKETRKRSRKELEVVTEVDGVQKASSPPAVCPPRSRRKTTVFDSAVVAIDESGGGVYVTNEPRRSTRNASRPGLEATSIESADSVGKVGKPRRSRRTTMSSFTVSSDEPGADEAAGNVNGLNEDASGQDAYVTDEPKMSTRNGSRQSMEATSNEIAKGLKKVGRPQRSRLKTLLSSSVASDETGAGEAAGKAKELNENGSRKVAYVTDEPRRSTRNASRRSSGTISGEMNDTTGEVGQENKKFGTDQKKKTVQTAVIVDESLVGRTPRHIRHASKSDLAGSSVPYESVEKKQQSISAAPIVFKETSPTTISGEIAANKLWRSKRNASGKHLTPTSDDKNENTSIGNIERQNEKCGSVQEIKSPVAVDESLEVISVPVEKLQSRSRETTMMKEITLRNVSGNGVYVTDELRRSTRSASRQRMAAISDEMNEIADGNVGHQNEKIETVQEKEAAVVVGNTPRRSTRHTSKSEYAEKKQPIISRVSVVKETTPTNNITGQLGRSTRSASRQHLAATTDDTNKIANRKNGKMNEKSETVEETETAVVVDKLVGSTPRQSTQYASKIDLVRSSSVRKYVEKQQRITRMPVMKDTTPTNNLGEGDNMTDSPRRSTRSASRQHLAATSDEMNEIGDGKAGKENNKSKTVKETETAVGVDEMVKSTSRQSTRHALKSDLVKSSSARKYVEKKQQSITRVPVMKETTQTNNSGEGAYMTDSPWRSSRSVSRQRLAATPDEMNEVAENAGKGGQVNEICETVEKTETLVINEGGKTPRRSARHAFKNYLLGSCAPVLKEQQSKSRLPIKMKESMPINISSPVDDTVLTISEATGERNNLGLNSYKALDNSKKRGASKSKSRGKRSIADVDILALHSDTGVETDQRTNLEDIVESAPPELATDVTEEDASKVAGESVAVNEKNIVLMDNTGNGITDGSIEDRADFDNHDSVEVKLAEFQAKACDTSNHSAEVDRIYILEGGVCGLERTEEDNAKEEMEEKLEPDNERSVPAVRAEILTKSSSEDVCQESDDLNDCSTEVERISVQEDEISGVVRTGEKDTTDRNDHGVVTHDRRASLALGANAVVDEIEDITHEFDDVNHQNHEKLEPDNERSVPAVSAEILTKSCSEDVCQESDDVNDCSTEVERISVQENGISDVGTGENDTTDRNDHGVVTHDRRASLALGANAVVDEIEDMAHEFDDVNRQNHSEVTSPHSDCSIRKFNSEHQQASGSKLSFSSNLAVENSKQRQDGTTTLSNSNDDLKDILEGIPEDSLPQLEQKVHNDKEMVVGRNFSIDVLMDVLVTEHCNHPISNMVGHQNHTLNVGRLGMEEQYSECSLVPDLGDYGCFQKVAAEVKYVGDSSFSQTICDDSSDPHLAMTVVKEQLNLEQCDQVLSDGTAECAWVMKLSDHGDGEEVATNLTQSQSIQPSDFFEGKDAELNSENDRMEEKRTKLEVSDSKVDTVVKLRGDHLDAEEAPEVLGGCHCDCISEKDKAADDETCIMAMDLQQAGKEGTSEPNSKGKPVKVISDCIDGLSKINVANPIALSEAASPVLGGLSDEVEDTGEKTVDLDSLNEKHALESDTSDFVDVRAGDAKEKDGKIEGNLDGTDTNSDAAKELDDTLFSSHESTFFTNWEMNMIYGNRKQDAVKSYEESSERNLIRKDLEDNPTSVDSEHTEQDNENAGLAEMQFGKAIPSVTDEPILDDEDSGQVMHAEQDRVGKLEEESLEDNLTSEDSEHTVQDNENAGLAEMQFAKALPSVTDEPVLDDEDKEVENTLTSAKEEGLVEAATSDGEEQDASDKGTAISAPDNLKEAENISDRSGQGISENVVFAKDKDVSVKPTGKINRPEEATNGGTLLSVFPYETSHEMAGIGLLSVFPYETLNEMAGIGLQKSIPNCSQSEDDVPTEILSFADTYSGEPEIDSGISFLQQNAKASYEEFEEQLMENDEVTGAENDGSQKAGEGLNESEEGSSLRKDGRDNQEVTEKELDLQNDTVNKAVSVDENDYLAPNKLSFGGTSNTLPAEAGEPHSRPDNQVLTVVNSKKAAEFENLDDISPYQHVVDGNTTSPVGSFADHEGQEYKVEKPSAQAFDGKPHENVIFTEQAAAQIAEDQQGECERPVDEVAQLKPPTFLAISDGFQFDKPEESEMQDNVPNNLDDIHSSIMCKFQVERNSSFCCFFRKEIVMGDVEDVGDAMELEDMPNKVETTADQSRTITSVVGEAGQSCYLKTPVNLNLHPQSKELHMYGEQLTCSVTKRNTSRTGLILRTPEIALESNAMKENAPSKFGDVASVNSLAKRRPLEDLRIN